MYKNNSVNLPDIKSLISALLSTPSVSCTSEDIDQGNRHVIDLLANWFDAQGFSCEIQGIEDSAQNNKANLIATLGTGNNGLVLAGHTDTVPYDDNRWQVDPFAGVETLTVPGDSHLTWMESNSTSAVMLLDRTASV